MRVLYNGSVVYEPPQGENTYAQPANERQAANNWEPEQRTTQNTETSDPFYGTGQHGTQNPVDSNSYWERRAEILRVYPYLNHTVGGTKPDDGAWVEWVTIALDIAGLIPVFGGPADIAAACLHFAMNEPWLGLLSLLGLVPVLEWGLAGVKALVRGLARRDAASIAALIPASVVSKLRAGVQTVRTWLADLASKFAKFTSEYLQRAEAFLNDLLDQLGVPRGPQLATAGGNGRYNNRNNGQNNDNRMRMDDNGNTGSGNVRTGFRVLRDGTANEKIAHGGLWTNIKNMFEGGRFYPDKGGLCFFTKQYTEGIQDTFKHGVDKNLRCSFAFKGTVDASGKRILRPDSSAGGFTDVKETLVVETSEAIGVVDEVLIRGVMGEGTVSIKGAENIRALFQQLETRGAAYINELFGRH